MKLPRDEKIVEEIRQEILDGALGIIVEEGFKSFTMRRLAAVTKMTAPNIYNYFSNKDEIYINIVIRGFRMLYSTMKQAYSESVDPYERIKIISKKYIEFGLANPQYYEIMFVSSTPKYRDYIGTSFEAISEIEYNISMDVVTLVLKAASELSGEIENGVERTGEKEISPKVAERHMIKVWSMLHGMICLCNSKVIPYVVEDYENVYLTILDESLESLFNELKNLR